MQIDRKNMERITRVNAETEIPLSEAVAAVQQRLGQVRVPPDFSVGFGSEVEEQAKSFEQLRLVLILAVLLVYAVMASQYESLRDPFIIMFSIPVAAIGVVLSLLLTNTPFSMQAYIGIIMLAGIVVSNAILLVDYINTLRRRDNMPLREAVELGGRTRLRPILMTSIATMLGLVPMALGLGDGGELQAPLARVVIGGLLASTLVTLVLVPAVYTLFEEGLAGLRRGMPSTRRLPLLGRTARLRASARVGLDVRHRLCSSADRLASRACAATLRPAARSPGRASPRRSRPAAPVRTGAAGSADAAPPGPARR